MARKLIYIAAPYSNGSKLSEKHIDSNVLVALKALSDLMDAGFDAECPHLSHYANVVYPKSYERWMELCLNKLQRCDAVLRIKGKSAGADREVSLAIDLGINVYKTVREVVEGEG